MAVTQRFADYFMRGAPYTAVMPTAANQVGNGWVDGAAGWLINSSGYAQGPNGQPQSTTLTLPAAVQVQDQQGDIIIAPQSAQEGYQVLLRYVDTGNYYSFAWFAGATGNAILGCRNGGAAQANFVVQANAVGGFNSTHWYRLRGKATGVNPTSLQLIITDLTTSSDVFTSAVFTDGSGGATNEGTNLQVATATAGMSSNAATVPTKAAGFVLADANGAGNASIAVNDANWQAGVLADGWVTTGSTSITGVWPGNRQIIRFNGTACHMSFSVANLTTASAAQSAYPWLVWRIDGSVWQACRLSVALAFQQGPLTLAYNLANGAHDLELLIMRSDSTVDRWSTPVQAVVQTGMQLDNGQSLSAPSTRANGSALFYWDSLGETALAIGSSGVGAQDTVEGTTYLLAAALGLDYATMCQSTWDMNYQNAAATNIPQGWVVGDGANQAMKSIYSGKLRSFTGLTDVFVLLGTNDATHAVSNATHQASVADFLTWLRGTAGYTGRVTFVLPPGRFMKTGTTAGVNQYVAANPGESKVKIVDCGAEMATGLTSNAAGDGTAGFGAASYHAPNDSGGIHMGTMAHGQYAALVANGYRQAWATAASGGGRGGVVGSLWEG